MTRAVAAPLPPRYMQSLPMQVTLTLEAGMPRSQSLAENVAPAAVAVVAEGQRWFCLSCRGRLSLRFWKETNILDPGDRACRAKVEENAMQPKKHSEADHGEAPPADPAFSSSGRAPKTTLEKRGEVEIQCQSGAESSKSQKMEPKAVFRLPPGSSVRRTLANRK